MGPAVQPANFTAQVDQLRAALNDAARQEAALVRSLTNPDLRIPHSEWTVREAAIHNIVALNWWCDWATDAQTARYQPVDQYFDGMAQLNARAIAEFPERGLARLADLILEGVSRFLVTTASLPAERPVPFHEGRHLSVFSLTCIATGELLVHGYDIAKAARRPWRIDPQVIRLLTAGTIPVFPMIVNRARAQQRMTFDIRLRGDGKIRLVFEAGDLAIEPTGSKSVDCHISADPVAFFLLSYGRVSQWPLIATGKVLAWGRKPWLGFKLVKLFRNP